MYDIPFSKMLQPRLSTTWAYNGKDTVFASYARYNPAASSLPRAASWDRNLAVDAERRLRRQRQPVRRRERRLVVRQAVRAGPDAATIDEWLVGTAKQFTSGTVGARLLPLSQGHALLGGHEQQRAHRVQRRRAGIPQCSSTSRI